MSPFGLFLLLHSLLTPVEGVFISHNNCLDKSLNNTTPHSLQFVPYFFDAQFDSLQSTHNINITVYGNVRGTSQKVELPPPDSPRWNDPDYTYGKIEDYTDNSDGRSKYATLFYKFNVLTYTPYNAPPSRFCNATMPGTECPIAPVFDGNASDPTDFRSFGISHNLNSSFRFTTIDSTIYVDSGMISNSSGEPNILACASASITPDLGPTLKRLLSYMPVAILLIVAISTISASIFSPWGTSDPFKWTSNYGRDEDLLRLVTPGFGDCLQYIQFILFSGSLSLNYPGYFSPVVSQVSWSALMFNESFVSGGSGTQSLRDGIYVTSGEYGLTRMSQLVGMSEVDDVWAGMVIWALVIIGIVVVICQLGFLLRWIMHALRNQPQQDLRSKNWPMTGGMLIRIVCNFFLLPVVALSMFQLVVAPESPATVTAFAVVLLVAILAFAGWILRIILTEKQRNRLFDDLPIVLLYGPLYNTYSDDAAPFALIPALLTFIRALAIGAVQPSGVAQLVILAICEVVLILTLHAFRPFRKQTSMNAYHTFFSAARLVVTLLSVAFINNLGVTEPTKGWIGYVVLLLHAIVLIFGFLLNSIQTLIEVVARAAGAGGDERTGAATRGALVKVFGSRQLSRRAKRPGFRQSMNSDAAILTEDPDAIDGKSGGRSRSLSASSAILLNQRTSDRTSTHLDRTDSASADVHLSEENAFSFLPGHGGNNGAASGNRPNLKLKTGEPGDVFYRPPRQRRPTGDLMTPGARSRGSWASGEWLKQGQEEPSDSTNQRDSTGKPMSVSPENAGRATPSPAYMRQRDGSDPVLNDPNRREVDYAVREVDFYYGVRGPALSNQPTRKRKTGPADPVGPVSAATGWVKGMLGRKTKESGKGFEVVRSSRVPRERIVEEGSPQDPVEPYRDDPQPQASVAAATLPGQRTRSNDADRQQQAPEGAREESDSEGYAPSSINSEDEAYDGSTTRSQSFRSRRERVSDLAPNLGDIDIGGDLGIPSRIGSKASSAGGKSGTSAPGVPRRSSKRESLVGGALFEPQRLSTVPDVSERGSLATRHDSSQQQARVPFTSPLSPHERHRSFGAESALSLEPPAPSFGTQSSGRQTSSNSLDITRAHDAERPTSGFVNQYRASDSITPGTPDLENRAGSRAEFVQTNSPRHSGQGRRSRQSLEPREQFGW
ncbi:MAG: hypothetical protein M1831_006206 [Alyxoria varia]|nr:MAG: hypothetical protein M1831_006206 [Alyxoria varia]